MALTWLGWLKQTVTVGGTGTLTLGPAAAGVRALGAAQDGLTLSMSIQDGTAWEQGLYTYTHSGTTLARTAFFSSSTGSALNVTTSALVFCDITDPLAASMNAAAQGVIPGGRSEEHTS